MGQTLAIIKTTFPAPDVEDIFDLDIDTSFGIAGYKQLATMMLDGVTWNQDHGTGTLDGSSVSIEVDEIGLWVRFASDVPPEISERLSKRALELCSVVIDEESAELIREARRE